MPSPASTTMPDAAQLTALTSSWQNITPYDCRKPYKKPCTALPCHCLSGCDALTGTLQTGMRFALLLLVVTPSGVFRLTGCDALTGTLQAGMRFALLLLVVTPSGVFRLTGCDALTGTLQTGMRFALFLLVVTPSGVLRPGRVRCPHGHTTSGHALGISFCS